VGLIGIAIAVLGTAGERAGASTGGDLQNRAARVAAEIEAAKTAGRWDRAAQERVIAALAPLAVMLIEQIDRATLAGKSVSGDPALRAAYAAIAGPLEGIYGENSAKLVGMAKKVMDEDGDIEALYETLQWQEAQALATQALYYRNWVYFYGARLHDKETSRRLLEEAERGFSELAVGDRRSELLVESLLGRALCRLELGNTEWAVRDFRLAIDAKETSPERRAKAMLGLVDAYLRAGQVKEALRASAEFLEPDRRSAMRPDELAYLRFLRAKALLSAAEERGSGAARERAEVLQLVEELRRAGKGWKERAESLLVASLEDPGRWAGQAQGAFAQWAIARVLIEKGEYERARPLLAALYASDDLEAKRQRPEVAYWLGVTEDQSGDFDQAGEHLRAALAVGGGEHRADATYLSFKVAEAKAAREPAPEALQQLRDAASAFVGEFPEHPSAYEGFLRLGELLQAEGSLSRAIEMYGRVKGDALFELKAEFGALQCRFERLAAAAPGSPARRSLLAEIGESLPRLLERADRLRQQKGVAGGEAEAVLAKATALRAVYVEMTGGSDSDILQALQGYEDRFPSAADALPVVFRLRLEALARSGRFADAQREVSHHATWVAGAEHAELLESLARRFLHAAAAAAKKGAEVQAQEARKVALRLYEIGLGEGTEPSSKSKLTLARLYQQTGERAKARALYEEVLASGGDSPAALRGLAQLAEEESQFSRAIELWQRCAAQAHPGDPAWYEAQYEIARATAAVGDRKSACALLEGLRPAMPGVRDADLRAKFAGLYAQACQ